MAKRKNENGEKDGKYQKLSDREHVLTRADMYCNSITPCIESYPVMNDTGKVEYKDVYVAPGLIQIIEEPIMNAADRVSARYEPGSSIKHNTTKISFEMNENSFTITNDGDGVPCDFLEEHGVYAPELIFGHLRTSTNYNDSDQRLNAGRNGLGVKISNIFSEEVLLETIDCARSLRYKQKFHKNMSVIDKPKMTKFSGKPYTKLTFKVEGGRFGCIDKTFSQDVMSIMRLKMHEVSMCSLDKIKVKFNEQNVKTDTPEKYLELFGVKKSNIVSHTTDRWKVAFAFTPENGGFRQHSFVNSTPTNQGGTHLNHVLDPVIKSLVETIKNKFKLVKLRPSIVKDALTVVVSAHLINPTFSSQTKDLLTLPVKNFGTSFESPDKFATKLLKMGLMEHVGNLLKNKDSTILKDNDGKKTSVIKGIPKLSDAKFAGTKKSDKCYLIVTEGDSALTMALSATSVIGRDMFGCFPLKGKMLNVRDASASSVSGNDEISNLKKILGLQNGVQYDNTSKLRYGGIILLTDADVDGIHIRGLLLNFFSVFWPSLLKIGYVHTLNTPILRATKRNKVKLFYNDKDYKEWVESGDEHKSYKIKYLKGLGSSTSNEAKEYFKNVHSDIVKYVNDINAPESMSLAFDKKRSNDRKNWLMEYNEDEVVSTTLRRVELSDFVNKELIHFSSSDMKRSIPSVVDGFKTTQRKVLCGSIQKGIINTEAKVAQLSGFIGDKMSYHHGEMALNSTIICMAQDYVGTNNIEILLPKGQLGSRLDGGKDAASPRYVFVQMNPVTLKVFNTIDNAVLNHLVEDGSQIEPKFYCPIIPMILVNGCHGIGTGFSSSIPQYNPVDLIKNTRRRLIGEEPKDLIPWYRGFKGDIRKTSDGNFTSHGVYTIKDNTVNITELPIGKWSNQYKHFLSGLLDKKTIMGFTERCTDTIVDFEVHLFKEEDIEILNLSSHLKVSNMHLFDSENRIKKYNNTKDIEQDHFNVRLEMYKKRKEFQLMSMRHEHKILSEKLRFFRYKINGKILMENKSYDDVINNLVDNRFKQLGKEYDSVDVSFGYITDIKLFDVTKEKMEKLKKDTYQLGEKIQKLEITSVENIWMSELDDLEKNI